MLKLEKRRIQTPAVRNICTQNTECIAPNRNESAQEYMNFDQGFQGVLARCDRETHTMLFIDELNKSPEGDQQK